MTTRMLAVNRTAWHVCFRRPASAKMRRNEELGMTESSHDPSDNNGGRRAQLRERNRLAMIEATLDCVAELGIARTSVSTIIERAGLSRGLIHFHFNGKDGLIEAAIAHASNQYFDNLYALLEETGPEALPQETVEAVIRSDMSPSILNGYNVSIWYAFRGEARERKSIQSFSDTRDDRLRALLMKAFSNICRAEKVGDPSQTARDATHGTLAFLEGMWTDYLLHEDAFDREQACRIIFRFLSGLFPNHFGLNGALRDHPA
ncbi:TetR family transcriptional regulator C-terminal domain-containing protein [Mameliella sp.]|uniref:TetR family transcriptional regulator C-terminal domain-containing protein n=2 Tax=Mameliella TaxID=1434019 RepID=UPI003BAC634D